MSGNSLLSMPYKEKDIVSCRAGHAKLWDILYLRAKWREVVEVARENPVNRGLVTRHPQTELAINGSVTTEEPSCP